MPYFPKLHRMVLWVVALLLAGCAASPEDVVATYRSAKLTRAELNAHLPISGLVADSAQLAEQYITQWRREQAFTLLLQDSFPELETSLNWQVDDYRRNVASYLLLEHLAATRVDTLITTEQLVTGYLKYRGDYLAQQPYVQVLHLELPRALLNNPSSGLTVLSIQQAMLGPRAQLARALGSASTGLDSLWVTLSQLSRYRAPAGVQLLAMPGRLVHVYFDTEVPAERVHFACVMSQVSIGEPMPLPVVAPLIRKLLLAQRRNVYLTSYEQQVLAPAYVRTRNN